MTVLEIEAAAEPTIKDRRRPGRLAHVSQELIPLLRGEQVALPERPVQFDEPDQLNSARGVALGVALSGAFWAAIAYTAFWAMS